MLEHNSYGTDLLSSLLCTRIAEQLQRMRWQTCCTCYSGKHVMQRVQHPNLPTINQTSLRLPLLNTPNPNICWQLLLTLPLCKSLYNMANGESDELLAAR